MPLLQRYVFCELLKVFSLALTGLTVLLVFVGVVGEAARSGLGPQQILQILPYIVPSLLPFTIPATLLLTVCVVYGRLAGDHEVTAVRAAGISVMALLWPSIFLGGILSLLTLVLTDQFIPWARANIQRTVTSAMEDIFLDMLRSQMQVVDPQNGISITVMGVRGKTLLMPTFRHTLPNSAVVTIQAQEANLEFDLEKQEVVLHL
ncbi:MAG TPA: LptF/LptG family permease, partial [Planctomycetaceae bacterium]|nr:LptF/LptG family permease [Planctomycetaceae bacterium]